MEQTAAKLIGIIWVKMRKVMAETSIADIHSLNSRVCGNGMMPKSHTAAKQVI